MARRTNPSGPIGPATEPDEAYLRWRFSWLVRAHLLAPGFQEVGREAARLRGLPIGEAVSRLEAFLAERGWLGRSERLIAHLDAARSRS